MSVQSCRPHRKRWSAGSRSLDLQVVDPSCTRRGGGIHNLLSSPASDAAGLRHSREAAMAAGIAKLAQIKPDGDAIYMSFAGSNPVRFLKQFDVGPYIALLIIEQALKATGGNTDDDPDSSKPC